MDLLKEPLNISVELQKNHWPGKIASVAATLKSEHADCVSHNHFLVVLKILQPLFLLNVLLSGWGR